MLLLLLLGLDVRLSMVGHHWTRGRGPTLARGRGDVVGRVQAVAWQIDIEDGVLGGVDIHGEELSVEVVFLRGLVLVVMLLH